jgi:hypothetical protein
MLQRGPNLSQYRDHAEAKNQNRFAHKNRFVLPSDDNILQHEPDSSQRHSHSQGIDQN